MQLLVFVSYNAYKALCLENTSQLGTHLWRFELIIEVVYKDMTLKLLQIIFMFFEGVPPVSGSEYTFLNSQMSHCVFHSAQNTHLRNYKTTTVITVIARFWSLFSSQKSQSRTQSMSSVLSNSGFEVTDEECHKLFSCSFYNSHMNSALFIFLPLLSCNLSSIQPGWLHV